MLEDRINDYYIYIDETRIPLQTKAANFTNQ